MPGPSNGVISEHEYNLSEQHQNFPSRRAMCAGACRVYMSNSMAEWLDNNFLVNTGFCNFNWFGLLSGVFDKR